MKSYTNRQLLTTGRIDVDYDTKLNPMFSELDSDLIELYAQDEALGNQLTQIIEETDLDPNKDPEVTNARNSIIYGNFDTVKLRTDNTDTILSNYLVLENKNIAAYGDSLTWGASF